MHALRPAFFVAAAVACAAQAPIPDSFSQLGWKLGSQTKPEATGVTVEIWGDFQCPDTRDAWLNVVKPLAEWVDAGSLPVTITYRPFPLPYHHNAYRSALSAAAAVELLEAKGVKTATAFSKVASQLLSDKQDLFQNAATANKTDSQIYADVLFPIVAAAGLDQTDKDAFVAKATARPTDGNLRVSWKYACSRGVTGTPVYAADYVVSNAAASWDLATWKNFIAAHLQ